MKKVLVSLVMLAAAASAWAQPAGQYPNRPVKIMLPFAPGGATDLLARMLAQFNEKKFGQPFVVENRPGGQTLIGIDAAAKSTPDGYTLLVTSSNVITEEALNPGWTVKMDRDLSSIALFAGGGYAVVASNNVPIRTMQDLVSFSRANPGKLNQAQAGAISADMEILKYRLKTGPIESILYKGGPLSVQAIVSGEANLYGAAVLDVVELEKAGKLKVLLYTESERHPLLPNVPTPRELNLGLDNYSAGFIFALMGPANIPADIVNRLNQASQEFVKSAPFIDTAVKKFGMVAYTLSPKESADRMQATLKSYLDAKAAGVKLR